MLFHPTNQTFAAPPPSPGPRPPKKRITLQFGEKCHRCLQHSSQGRACGTAQLQHRREVEQDLTAPLDTSARRHATRPRRDALRDTWSSDSALPNDVGLRGWLKTPAQNKQQHKRGSRPFPPLRIHVRVRAVDFCKTFWRSQASARSTPRCIWNYDA